MNQAESKGVLGLFFNKLSSRFREIISKKDKVEHVNARRMSDLALEIVMNVNKKKCCSPNTD